MFILRFLVLNQIDPWGLIKHIKGLMFDFFFIIITLFIIKAIILKESLSRFQSSLCAFTSGSSCL